MNIKNEYIVTSSFADFLVRFFVENGIEYIHGHPGGMISFLTDSVGRSNYVHDVVFHHEQAAALAACAISQSTDYLSVAYSTSGPGVTNLITGIANAYFDSIPVFFITGNVSSSQSKINHEITLRQYGFQEMDVVELTKSITKESRYLSSLDDAASIVFDLANTAMTGRKGPVVLDIPVNLFKEQIHYDIRNLKIERINTIDTTPISKDEFDKIREAAEQIYKSEKPLLIIGKGVNHSTTKELLKNFISKFNIPYCSSMISTDLQTICPENYFGFIGVYGQRLTNILVNQADLVISIGTRLDLKQIGFGEQNILKSKKLIRVDVDQSELNVKKSVNELSINIDANRFLLNLESLCVDKRKFDLWLSKATKVSKFLKEFDKHPVDNLFDIINSSISDFSYVALDVGQNQVWASQKLKFIKPLRIFTSGGLGTMGYAIPAGIGLALNSKRNVLCISGDGGFQMNIQEIETIIRNDLPITILILNNQSLGMITEFQDTVFESRNFGTKSGNGYSNPDFIGIMSSYGFEAVKFKLDDLSDLSSCLRRAGETGKRVFIEIEVPFNLEIIPRNEQFGDLFNRKPKLDNKTIRLVYDMLN